MASLSLGEGTRARLTKFAFQYLLMGIKYFLYSAVAISIFYFTTVGISGCAQIGMPTGGLKDSLAPVLVTAVPALNSTNFKGNKIVFTFNEYVDVQDAQNNVLVSPFPKTNPQISFKLKTVTVKIKDTLLANTTYAINFGNAIRDNNEGNPYKNFTYVFSTGNTIDSLKLRGKVLMAESGKADSTLVALLYRNAPDSAVETRRPDYLAKLDKLGNFTFINLSAGSYKLYALKDGDGGKTYNSKIEPFAFNDTDVMVADSTAPVTMYAYAEEKDNKSKPTASQNNITAKAPADKKIKFSTSLTASLQSLLAPLSLSFSKPLKSFDDKKIILTDSSFRKIDGVTMLLDSTKKILNLTVKWTEDFDYRLIINKEAATDTMGNQFFKTDTIRFKSKRESDYGNLLIRFTNYQQAKHPVLQFFKGDEMIASAAITGTTWSDKLFEPGEYEIRILYDENKNGKWDPGNYTKKIQPEKAVTLEKKITVRANWDNEKDVEL